MLKSQCNPSIDLLPLRDRVHQVRRERGIPVRVTYFAFLLVGTGLSISQPGAAQDAAVTGLEVGAGMNLYALANSQWSVNGGPGLDVVLGYRWSSDVALRGVVGATLGNEEWVAPDVFRPGTVTRGTSAVVLPHATAELLFQPRAQRGIVDPSVGIRAGFIGHESGALAFGARAGPRFRVSRTMAIEAGAMGDLVYFVSQGAPWTARGGVYVSVIGLQVRR